MRHLWTTALSLPKHVLDVGEPLLSSFPVDYLPDGSAVLHRSSTSGCFLVHALVGAIRAPPLNEAMGAHRARQAWSEP